MSPLLTPLYFRIRQAGSRVLAPNYVLAPPPLYFKDLPNWIKSLAPKYVLAPPALYFRIFQTRSRVLAPKYVALYILGFTNLDQESGAKCLHSFPFIFYRSAKLDQEFSVKICLSFSPLSFRICQTRSTVLAPKYVPLYI
jgi:hypothetical protein